MAYKWRVLLTVGIGTYMATMDSSIVNIAIPTLARVFGASPNTALWASLAFILTVTGLTLTLGRVGDLFGRKRIYVGGFAVFTTGMALCGFAPSLPLLVAARVLQACGSAMIVANGMAIVTSNFPPHERGKALGTTSAIVGAGLMSGPVIGGLLLEAFDWRAIFIVRLPLGLIGLMTAWRVLRDAPPADIDRRLDLPGGVTLFVALAALLVGVNRGQTWGWASPQIIALTLLAVSSLLLFVRIESLAANPVLAVSLFRNRMFSASVLNLALNFVATSSVSLMMPFYFLRVRGLTASATGLLMVSVPLLMLVLSPIAGSLSDKAGPRLLGIVGVTFVTTGLASLTTLREAEPIVLVVARLALLGAGSAFFQTPNSSSIMGQVPRTMLGIGSGTIATGRNIGQSLGLAMAGTVFTSFAASAAGVGIAAAGAGPLPPSATLAGIHAAFTAAAALSLLSVAVSFVRAAARAPAQAHATLRVESAGEGP
ncbi:MAG: MFS transporter [Dehalococcoidia bacterium]